MKKTVLTTLTLAGAGVLAIGTLASCGGGDASNPIKITVAVNQTEGTTFESVQNWMNAASTELGFEWDYVAMSTRDNASNLSALQQKLINGSNGIISMVDLDSANLGALLSSLKDNNAYYAGFETEFANAKNANLLSNDRIVGAVSDGEGGASRGERLFDEVVKTTNRKIVFGQYPASYFPSVQGAVDAFVAKAEEWNTAHPNETQFTFYNDTADTYTNGGNTYKFTFNTAVPAAEYQKWTDANVDAIVCVNSIAKLVLPTATQATNKLRIFSVGFDDSTKSSLGGEILKTLSQTPAETIFFPVVQLINALNGKSYSDAPTDASNKVVTGHYIYLTSQADLTSAADKIMNFSSTHDLTHCLIQPSEVKSMLAGQSGATYQALVNKLDSWTSSNLFNA